MTRATDRALSTAEMHAFGEELDAIRDRVIGSLGASDTRYIRRVAAAVRWFGVGGRGLLFLAAFSPLFWMPLLWPAAITGTLLLALSKILENMELGHNVMHGQFDWTGDPKLNGNTYEWDIVATASSRSSAGSRSTCCSRSSRRSSRCCSSGAWPRRTCAWAAG